MANRVDIDIYANDKTAGGLKSATDGLDDIKGSFENLTGISMSTAGMLALAGGAISGIVEITQESIDKAVEYNDQISEIARITGLSLEDSSRLIQVADDMGVEYKDLAKGLGNATKEGVEISIESLLSMADEYKKLESPIDRAKWLTENFGAAGAGLAPIFETASSDIATSMEGVDEALVWDDEKQAMVDSYESGLGEIKDSFDSLKMKVAVEVMPVIMQILDVMNNKEGSRGEGLKRMLGDTEIQAMSLKDRINELITAIGNLFSMSPGAGHASNPASLGLFGFTAPQPYGHAGGGYEMANTPHMVGELGPELFVPNSTGKIIPNNQLSGGGIDIDRLARSIGQEVVQALVTSGYLR